MSVKELDAKVLAVFREMMGSCKEERIRIKGLSLRALAKTMGKTENYVGAVESGRTFPSLRTFLKYLVVNDFDVQPLLNLQIRGDAKGLSSRQKQKLHDRLNHARSDQLELLHEMLDLDTKQVSFISEQVRLTKRFKISSISGQ